MTADRGVEPCSTSSPYAGGDRLCVRPLQMLAAAAALAATLGGRVDVKMNWGAKLLTASTIARSPR